MTRYPEEWDSERHVVIDSEGDVKPDTDFLDGDGVLQEAPDERVFDTPVVHEFASAALRLGVIERHETRNPHWPATVERVIAERKEKETATPIFERDDAYESLGGGLPANRETELSRDERLKGVIAQFQPWQTDIRTAVEQFGVVDYTPRELAAMERFDEYCIHFYGFMQSVEAHRRLIIGAEGRVDIDPTVLGAQYPGRSAEELLDYVKKLDWLEDELNDTGIPQAVLAHLEHKYGKLEGWKDAYSKSEVVRANRVKVTDKVRQFRKTHPKHRNSQLAKVNSKLRFEFV